MTFVSSGKQWQTCFPPEKKASTYCHLTIVDQQKFITFNMTGANEWLYCKNFPP